MSFTCALAACRNQPRRPEGCSNSTYRASASAKVWGSGLGIRVAGKGFQEEGLDFKHLGFMASLIGLTVEGDRSFLEILYLGSLYSLYQAQLGGCQKLGKTKAPRDFGDHICTTRLLFQDSFDRLTYTHVYPAAPES